MVYTYERVIGIALSEGGGAVRKLDQEPLLQKFIADVNEN